MPSVTESVARTPNPAKGIFAQRKEPLAGAYFWVLVFLVAYCGRPEDYIPGVVHLHLAKIAGVFALIAFVMSLGQLKKGIPRETGLLVLLLIQFGLAAIFSPVYKARAIGVTFEFSKAVLIIIVMVLAVTTWDRLRKLLFVQAGAVALIGAISVLKGRLYHKRLMGVVGGIYANPNDLAIALVLCLPLALFFMFQARSGPRKLLWAAAALMMTYGVFLTASRAGFLALVIVALMCLWEFGVKGRRAYLIPLAFVALVMILAFAGKNTTQRLSDTFSSHGDYEHAHGSATHREALLIKSIKVTLEHPIFGIGPGDFQIISGQWNQTHNVYTALSAEAGLPALLLFLAIYWISFANLREVRKKASPGSGVSLVAQALRASLIAFAPAAFFFPDAYQYFIYFMFAYTTLARQVAAREASAKKEEQPIPGRRTSYTAVPLPSA